MQQHIKRHNQKFHIAAMKDESHSKEQSAEIKMIGKVMLIKDQKHKNIIIGYLGVSLVFMPWCSASKIFMHCHIPTAFLRPSKSTVDVYIEILY